MILIIGGAYQGKLAWCLSNFKIKKDEVCDLSMGFVPGKKCYRHLEEYTKDHVAMPDFPADSIIISREIGCGIVPMERENREYRERHSLVLQDLAKGAEAVYRVYCGIGEKIYGKISVDIPPLPQNYDDIENILSGNQPIKPINKEIEKTVKKRWDGTAKPLDSLGKFERVTASIGGILENPDFDHKKRVILTFCSDNGVVEENISQSGQEITALVAAAMGRGEASVSKMAALSETTHIPIDIGINSESKFSGVLDRKIVHGTKNFARSAALSDDETKACLQLGMDIAKALKDQGITLCGIGEMGIGNTTTASAVAAGLLKLPAVEVTGRGAGLSDEGLKRKLAVIETAISKYDLYNKSPFEILRLVGGADIAGMTGVILGGAVFGLPIVLDGVVSTVSALLAERMLPGAGERTISSHRSRESSASLVLSQLGLTSFIEGDMALGEGTGAAMFFSLLDQAMCLYTRPTSFSDIGMEAYNRFL